MKHRGRHRRRKQGRAVRAFLAGTALALTAAATMISASQATVGDNPGALTPLTRAADTGALRLQEQLVPQATLDELSAGMGRPVGVGAVLETADRSLRPASGCTAGERTALPVAPAATRAYCWDTADTRAWQPGAVTTSGDADDDGWWNDHRVILSGWSRQGADRDLARVAFVDANDLAHLRYASALLVVPVDGGRDYRALTSRLTGMVWYQDKLLVTAGDGLYVYDMNRVQRTTVLRTDVGRVAGGWSAHGYRFVLPAVGSYRMTGGSEAPRLGGISLDRSTAPDSLVASESTPSDSDRPARLWRYDFSKDPARPGLLATDATGSASAVEAYETEASGIAGVLSHRADGSDRADWYVGRSPGSTDRHGSLWRQDGDGAEATRCGDENAPRCWGTRVGPLSYWEATGEVWSQSGRMLFALPLESIDRALG
ncbi:hypothetical protein [Streptomyces sp. NPDC093568]|uniref:hypothetical protein n=1 Tax=Streptomyces sp. NPDC093568 TaxID=3366041 RepID=UPI003823C956